MQSSTRVLDIFTNFIAAGAGGKWFEIMHK